MAACLATRRDGGEVRRVRRRLQRCRFGIDDAGISRLPALEVRGIAGACVSAWSARIGDGQSTYRDGFVSAMNVRAAAYGGEIGMPASELVARLVAARMKELK